MKQKKKESQLSKLLSYAGKTRSLLWLSAFLAATSGVLTLLPFYQIWLLIQEILRVNPDFSEAKNITLYGIMAVVYSLIALIVYVLSLLCSHKVAFRVQVNMRKELLNHVMHLPIGSIEKEGSGKIKKIIFDSTAMTENYLAHNFPDKVVSAITPLSLIVLMFVFDWRLGLISLIPAVLAFLAMGFMMTGKKMKEDMKQYQDTLENMSAEATEYVRGVPVIKTFNQTLTSFKKFENEINNYEKWVIKYTKNIRPNMVLYTLFSNSVFLFLIFAAYLLQGNELTLDFTLNVIFYILISSLLTIMLMRLAYAGETSVQVQDALNRIDSILEQKTLSSSEKQEKLRDGAIEIKNISFSYNHDERKAIKNLSMVINKGEHVAFVGPSGGGKTTLANLISRFFDVEEGEIKIGGVNIKDVSEQDLMNHVSYVFQDSKLLPKSIFENVRMGKPDATESEVLKALEDAQCMDILHKFKDGIHTVIGSKGVFVSGGEAQRLAIARAFLKNAPILILDEATAFADPDNEYLVQKSYEKLAVGKTVILIAHRLSTIKNVDKIYVLKEGEIVEQGKHDELLVNANVYAHLWEEYNKAVQWKLTKAGN